jgi:hypothetical protein
LAPVFDKLAESRKKREPPLKSELKATAKEASRAPKSAAPDHADEVLGKAADFLKVREMKKMPLGGGALHDICVRYVALRFNHPKLAACA